MVVTNGIAVTLGRVAATMNAPVGLRAATIWA
jgi:hypothetical protein